jgi:hypothetical protein
MNTLFGLPYAYPVALGYNCHVKVLVDRIGELERIGYPRLPFDWLGTPMYSICDVLEKDFEDFTNNDFFKVERRKNHLETEYLTNIKYDLCFVHDYGKDIKNISITQFEKTEEDYKRRIQRWKSEVIDSPKVGTLPMQSSSGRHIVFFRLEQLNEERTQYLREEPEIFYVERFAKWMSSQEQTMVGEKGIHFHIIWFSQTATEKSYDKTNKIITLPFRMRDIKITISADHLQPILQMNLGFVKDCLHR